MADLPYDHYEDQIRALAVQFTESVAAISKEEVLSWKDGPKILGVARAICQSNGRDPDGIVLGIPHAQIVWDGKRQAAFQFPIRPTWWSYLAEASAAVKYLGAEVKPETAVDFMAAVREVSKP